MSEKAKPPVGSTKRTTAGGIILRVLAILAIVVLLLFGVCLAIVMGPGAFH